MTMRQRELLVTMTMRYVNESIRLLVMSMVKCVTHLLGTKKGTTGN